MKQELDKCVLVIDEAMPRGLAANTAAILGITWGRLRPELVGEDVTDAAGAIHPGIIRTPVPVLSGRPETFQTLRRQLAELEFADVAAVDFTDLAQSCRTYGEFIEKMARTGPGELRYLGMALLGPEACRCCGREKTQEWGRARLRPHSRIISRRTYGPCWINRSTSASPPLVYK